jgi:hypothetical protein
MVGEVIGFNANFSNLVALMKNNYDEAMTYRQNGKFIKPGNTVYTRKELEDIRAEKLKELGIKSYLISRIKRRIHFRDISSNYCW